jgi:hypothetical protein
VVHADAEPGGEFGGRAVERGAVTAVDEEDEPPAEHLVEEPLGAVRLHPALRHQVPDSDRPGALLVLLEEAGPVRTHGCAKRFGYLACAP